MGKRIPVFNEITLRLSFDYVDGALVFLSPWQSGPRPIWPWPLRARGHHTPPPGQFPKNGCANLPLPALIIGTLRVRNKPSQKRTFVRRYGMMKNNGKRVALYARVSTRDKRQDTENQLTHLRQFTVTQGWAVAAEYVDRTTGKHSDREQFQRLFQDASQRKFDLVLFWSLDRFSREGVRETLNHLEQLTSYGVGYRSFTEQYLDSCGLFKDAVLAVLAVIAKQERVRLSERTIAGLEKARKHGRVGGRPKVICDRDKVKRLREAGLSLTAIATKVGASKGTVHRLLG